MSTTERQERMYKHTCNIYKPNAVTAGASGFGPNDPLDLNYPSTPTSTAVSWYYQSGPEFLRGKFYGRRNQEDTVSLMDQGHFYVDADVDANYVIQMTSTDHPKYQQFFLVMGESTPKEFAANKRKVFIKNVTKPLGIA